MRSDRTAEGGAHIQEWRSDRTGRTFEVEESHAYAWSDELTPGDAGYLHWVAGTPVVDRTPDVPAGGVEIPPAGTPHGSGRQGARARPNWLVWGLVGVVLAVIVWGVMR